MPLNKLDNFLKNVEGRILYVSPSDLDSTDSITNEGNSQTRPFKTLQRALIEAARFSYNIGNNNDAIEKTTILLMPGEHLIDNRPGYGIQNDNGAKGIQPDGTQVNPAIFDLTLESNFDLTQESNILYKFNSIHGGVIVPRGTSIVGLDLRKTKLRPKYVPNPTDNTPDSAIFRITGGCYFWQFSIFDGDENSKVYTNNTNFTGTNLATPTFSHHKLTCFEYADGVNIHPGTGITDLNMYYYKLSIAYSASSTRSITEKFPSSLEGFASRRAEYEIVGAFANDPVKIAQIQAGDGFTPSNQVTVTTLTDHNLDVGTPIKINGVQPSAYNISAKVSSIDNANPKVFTYTLSSFSDELSTPADNVSNATVIVETDTVDGSSPYIFNCSLRSVYGANGMKADGNKATGFKSMVVAQFTGVSLQKDDRAFVKYDQTNRAYAPVSVDVAYSGDLSTKSSSTNPEKVYHLDSEAIYRQGWETTHVNIINDAILQVVSVFAIGYNKHFAAESGGDASITNSNSNFGQLALVADGFKKNAFNKDDKAYLTHIITPRAITTQNENIDWMSIDSVKTSNVGVTSHLYLTGFTSKDIKPPHITQGYRIGAKKDDVLHVVIGGQDRTASIYMGNAVAAADKSSVKEYAINSPISNIFTVSNGGTHELSTGEKVILISEDGDLPENIEEETGLFVIRVSNSQFRLAASKNNADNGEGLLVYGGTNLKVFSRVTDKSSGDVAHPVQWDDTNNQWYVLTNENSTIYSNLPNQKTEPTYVVRQPDSRNIDDKIYKIRVVIPKEFDNAKNPENGFILQESSTTGVRTDGDFTKKDAAGAQGILSRQDFDFDRNPRYISTCTYSTATGITTVTAERPHGLNVGDEITIKNVTTTDNTVGAANSGYNGSFKVSYVPNSLEFNYVAGRPLQTSVTNSFSTRDTNLPRFERTDLQSNIYLYRNETLSEYIRTEQDGIFHGYPLNASVGVPTGFTDYKYGQNVTDLYPQLDRDNINDNPKPATTFAVRAPLGKTITNDIANSITRETTNKLVTNLGIGYTITSSSALSGGISTVTFNSWHNVAGILTAAVNNSSTNFDNGTYYNVKLFTSEGIQNNLTWNGSLSKVVVSGGSITGFDISNPGSGWQVGDYAWFDKSVIGQGGSNGNLQATSGGGTGLTVDQIGTSDNFSVQITGAGSTADGYYRITKIPSKNKIAIGKTAGDDLVVAGQYAFIVGPSPTVSAVTTGTETVFTSSTGPHGLVPGNRFQFNDSSHNNLGTFIVKEKDTTDPTTKFTATTNLSGTISGYVVKHAFSANDAVSEKGDENLSVRGIDLFDTEHAKLNSAMTAASGTIRLETSLTNKIQRFPFGSYLQIDDEILRVNSNILQGGSNNQISVIRGVLGTSVKAHDNGSLVKRIKPVPLEFHRPSILRASGHTFEYLGYGPGNYSTSLPQVQIRTLTEKEEYLSQSQERAAGAVVYTGMNNKGDFYVGNQKQSALTGENTSFDVPVPKVAGEDPSRLSVVFDEVTVKERLVVEGGKSNTALSEFDGPVTFNGEVQLKNPVKIKDATESTSSSSGALVITGGVGIGGTVNIGAGSSFSLPDNTRALFGDDNDLEIYHGSTQSGNDTSVIRSINSNTLLFETREGSIAINNRTGDGALNFENMITATANSHVRLYHDGVKKLQTTETGLVITGISTADYFYGDGSNITGIDAGNVSTGIITSSVLGGGTADATTYLNGDGQWVTIDKTKLIDSGGTTRAQATTDGVTLTGTLDFGASTLDIYHNATDGSIDVKEGSLTVRVKDTAGKGFYIEDPNGGSAETIAKFEKNATGGAGRCELMYGGTKVFETVSGGVTITGALEVTGDITALTSDIRLKDEISPITKALEKVKSINGFTYKHNETAKVECNIDTGDQRFAGVSAQEIQAVLPEAVKPAPSNNEYLTVQYEKLVPLLIEAVKELSAKVNTLEASVTSHTLNAGQPRE